MLLGLLKKRALLVSVIIIVFCITGCVSNYHVQKFSSDIESLPVKTIEEKLSRGRTSTTTIIEGTFKANNLEAALKKAEDAGYNKLLSIEYGTNVYFGVFGSKWVIIRCLKDS